VSNTSPSFTSQLLIAVITIFLGSFLFAGILESYKKDQSVQKELIKDYYRPMRAMQATCASNHNQLFLKHGEMSGSYQLMYSELEHMFVTSESELGRDYEAIPMSIFKANSELKLKIKELNKNVSTCRSELFLKYEEVALVTGTYPEFYEFAQERAKTVNVIYSKRKELANENTKEIDPNELLPMMREFLAKDLSSHENKSHFLKKLESIFEPTKKHNLILMETEQEIFETEHEFFKNIHTLFSKEISDKHSNGFLSWLF